MNMHAGAGLPPPDDRSPDPGGCRMSAFNVVRFRVKPGQDEAFLEAHRNGKARWPGLVAGHIIKTGEHAYCLVGQWPSQAVMAEAMPAMVATLNTFRAVLEDQGAGKGVTDAVSGAVVLDVRAG
jgi:hypothetical protein